MVPERIDEALRQVRDLQDAVLERRMFRGYSGTARLACGALALGGAWALDSARVPRTDAAHLAGWGLVLGAALALNYGALAWWFLTSAEARRNPASAKPAVDALPALIVGAVASLALWRRGLFDLLPGAWMMLYGLAQTAYRRSLPGGIFAVGLVYVLCGALVELAGLPFTNPWPMGIVFGLGELAGGWFLLEWERGGGRRAGRDEGS